MKKSYYWVIEIFCSSDIKEPVVAVAHEFNCSGIQFEDERVLVYFLDATAAEGFKARLQSLKNELKKLGFGGNLSYNYQKRDFQPWDEQWRASLKPVVVGKRLIVLTPWHKYTGERTRIVIEPGMAFGTGQHETTQICLEEIERLSAQPPDSLLDVGTGTGILAIAAIKLGIKKVVAIDIDHEAVRIARENAKLNKAGQIMFVQASPSAIKARFSTVVANLTLKSIKEVFKELKRLLEEGGKMILSGILIEQEPEVRSFLATEGISGYSMIKRGKWLGLTL